MVTEVRLVARKAPTPIVITELPRVKDSKLKLLLNAYFPISITESGIVTEVSDVL